MKCPMPLVLAFAALHLSPTAGEAAPKKGPSRATQAAVSLDASSPISRQCTREATQRHPSDETARAAYLKECLLAPRTWYGEGLATVAVGRDEKGLVGRRFTLYITGPSPLGTRRANEIDARLRATLPQIRDVLYQSIDAKPSAPSSVAQGLQDNPAQALKSLYEQANQRNAASLSNALEIAALSLRDRLANDVQLTPAEAQKFGLALFEGPCETRNGCDFAPHVLDSRSASFDRYAKLREWARQAGVVHPNRLVELNVVNGVLKPEAAKSARLHPAVRERTERTPEEYFKAFESFIPERRRKGMDVSYVAAEFAAVPRDALLTVADAVDTPSFVFDRLPQSGRAFERVSNELARTRILECRRFRGALSEAELSQCAGYIVDAATITSCMNGGTCRPSVGKELTADLLLIAGPTSNWRGLALHSSLPRIGVGSVKPGQEEETLRVLNSCRDNSETAAEFARCLATHRGGETMKKTYACLQEASGKKGRAYGQAIGDCVVSLSKLSAEDARRLECASRHESDARGMALCLYSGQLPREASAVISCANRLSDAGRNARGQALFDCAVAGLGPNERQAFNCLREARTAGNWQDGALCVAKGKIPSELQDAIECNRKHAGQFAAVAACYGGKNLPEPQGRVLRCAAESGFDATGTALCMAGDGLTPDQRILLQCATTSGGEPMATAICTGGKLAIKEFQNCKDQRFGKGKCFGSGNDLLKIAKRLGSEIGPNSVVADIVNLQLRLLEFQRPPIEAGQAVLDGVMKHAAAVVEADLKTFDLLAKGQIGAAAQNAVKAACRRAFLGVIRC